MKHRLSLIVVLALLALTSLPAAAQSFRVTPTVQPPRVGVIGQVFVPGIGFRPIIQERFPVFGLGFDAHHHSILNQQLGIFGGGDFGNNFFVGGFAPFFPVASSSSTVVIVQQPMVVQVPVVVNAVTDPPVAVAAGLPENWDRITVVRSSYPPEQHPMPQLTLLVQKNQTIFAVREYWLDEGRVFYVTSTGRQGSILLRDLDWDMTVRLNAERHVEFVLHSEP